MGIVVKFFVSNIYPIVAVVLAVIVVLVGIAIMKSRERATSEVKVTNPSYVSPTFSPMPATPTKTLPETGYPTWMIVLLLAGIIGSGIIIRKISSRGAES